MPTGNFNILPDWMKVNRFFKKDLVNGGEMKEVSPEAANLVSSHLFTKADGTEMHLPVIDLDLDAALFPSTTPGHHHLFINKPMSAEAYEQLLRALNAVGILQDGIIDKQWKVDGMTCARLPGIVKESNSLSSGFVATTGKTVSKQVHADYELNSKVGMTVPADNAIIKATDDLESVAFPKATVVNSTFENPNISQNWEDGSTEALTADLKSAMIVFKNLAQTAQKTGDSLASVVEAWKNFVSAYGDEPQNKPQAGNKPEW